MLSFPRPYWKKTVAVLLGALVFTLGAYSVVLAAPAYPPGGIYGRAQYRGYFTNAYDDYGTVVLQPRENGLAIPPWIDTVDEFINLLRSANNNAANNRDGRNDRTGSAFIVYTMLGLNGAPHDRRVTDVNWNELRSRLDARQSKGMINWGGTVDSWYNSIYQDARSSSDTATDDVSFHVDHKSESGIIIKNDDGSMAYEILRRCANPMGNYVGIPPSPPPPPVEYSLTPTLSNTTSGVVEPESPIAINPRVDNSGPAASTNTLWQLTSFLVNPGSAVPSRANGTPSVSYDSDQAPCQFFGLVAGVTNCGLASFTAGGDPSGTFSFPVGPWPYTTRAAVIGDLAAGTKVCYALSVQPRTHDSGQWRHSNPTCVTVGKKPKLQIWGGDLISANTVNAGSSTKNINGTTRTFGSWVEYGIFAVGKITGAASGSAYAGPGLASADNCNISFLSFTNSGSSSCSPSTVIGNYANSSSIPDVAASFPTTSSTPFFGSNDLSVQSQNGVFRVNGNAISLSAGNIQKGRWVVINAPAATVTITGDIKYTEGQLLSVSDIPQVIIIANKIIINSKVTRVDAWLIASGTDGIIETCNVSSSYALSGANRLTSKKCDLPLTVNGPVMAKQLWLRRTAGSGSGPASGNPAEVFNLRPDAYMWASLRASGNNRVQTVYSTELPPRL